MTEENKHKQYIKEMDIIISDYKDSGDNEDYHEKWDILVQKILEENGYEDIAKEYKEAEENDFWYA